MSRLPCRSAAYRATASSRRSFSSPMSTTTGWASVSPRRTPAVACGVGSQGPQVDAGDVTCRVPPSGLLRHPATKVRRRVPERCVCSELCLSDRRVPLGGAAGVVDRVDRDPARVREGGHDNHTVRGLPGCGANHLREGVGLQGKVPAQRRVRPRHEVHAARLPALRLSGLPWPPPGCAAPRPMRTGSGCWSSRTPPAHPGSGPIAGNRASSSGEPAGWPLTGCPSGRRPGRRERVRPNGPGRRPRRPTPSAPAASPRAGLHGRWARSPLWARRTPSGTGVPIGEIPIS